MIAHLHDNGAERLVSQMGLLKKIALDDVYPLDSPDLPMPLKGEIETIQFR